MGGPEEAPTSDAELLRLAKQGDTLAFEIFIRRHDAGIRALTVRLLGRFWAEDVLQETYLKAYRALPSVQIRSSQLSGWLYRIAYRSAIDELRRIKRTRSMSFETIPDLMVVRDDSDDRLAERIDLSHALDGLSDEQKASIVLVDQLGFDYEAAAQILQVPRGTVASRLNHARAALREALASSRSVSARMEKEQRGPEHN